MQESSATPTLLVDSQKVAVVGANASGDGLAKAASQELQASGKQETTKTSKSDSKVDGSQSAATSKVSPQVSNLIASPSSLPATGSITGDPLVASLAGGTTGSFSITGAAASAAPEEGIFGVSEAASADSSRLIVPQHLSAASVSAAQTAVGLQTGSGGKSGALAAWRPIGPATIVSPARVGTDNSHPPPVESAVEAPSPASSSPALAKGLLASNLNRSTAILVPTAFTDSGEQRVPPVAHDLAGDGSGSRCGVTGISDGASVSASVSTESAQTTVPASSSSLAANVHAVSATSAWAIAKTSGAAHGTAVASVVSSRPLTSLPIAGGTRRTPQEPESKTLSPAPAVIPGAVSEQTDSVNASLPLRSTSTVSVPVTASGRVSGIQRSTVGASSASERTKGAGTTGAVAQPVSTATTGSAKDSTDHGVSSDSGDNVASAGTGGLAVAAVADHIATPQVVNGAGGGVAAVSALSSQAAHQGTGVSAPATTSPVRGAVSGLGGLSATTETESGHPVSTLHSAISFEPHQTLEVTPTTLEVGVHSGTQGWLKIRAEVGGEGEVSASLAATSSGGDQMLKGQLPALNAYLHSEQMSVTASVAERTVIAHGAITHDSGSATLQSGTSSSSGQNAPLLDGGASQGMAGHGGRSQSDAGSAPPVQAPSSGDGQTGYEASHDRRVSSDGAVLPSTATDSSGQWLNVRV